MKEKSSIATDKGEYSWLADGRAELAKHVIISIPHQRARRGLASVTNWSDLGLKMSEMTSQKKKKFPVFLNFICSQVSDKIIEREELDC